MASYIPETYQWLWNAILQTSGRDLRLMLGIFDLFEIVNSCDSQQLPSCENAVRSTWSLMPHRSCSSNTSSNKHFPVKYYVLLSAQRRQNLLACICIDWYKAPVRPMCAWQVECQCWEELVCYGMQLRAVRLEAGQMQKKCMGTRSLAWTNPCTKYGSGSISVSVCFSADF